MPGISRIDPNVIANNQQHGLSRNNINNEQQNKDRIISLQQSQPHTQQGVSSSQQQQQQQQSSTSSYSSAPSSQQTVPATSSSSNPSSQQQQQQQPLPKLNYPNMRRAFSKLTKGGSINMNVPNFLAAASRAENGIRPGIESLWTRCGGDSRRFISQLQCTTENALIQGSARTSFGYEVSLHTLVREIAPVLLHQIQVAEAKEEDLAKLISSAVCQEAASYQNIDNDDASQQQFHRDPTATTGAASMSNNNNKNNNTSTTTSAQKISFLNHQVDEYILSIAEYFCDAVILSGNETLWRFTVEIAQRIPNLRLAELYVEYLNKKAASKMASSSATTGKKSATSNNSTPSCNSSQNSTMMMGRSTLSNASTTCAVGTTPGIDGSQNSFASTTAAATSATRGSTNTSQLFANITNTVQNNNNKNNNNIEDFSATLDEDSCPALSQQSANNNKTANAASGTTTAGNNNNNNNNNNIASAAMESAFPIEPYIHSPKHQQPVINLAWFNINHFRRIMRRELASAASFSSQTRSKNNTNNNNNTKSPTQQLEEDAPVSASQEENSNQSTKSSSSSCHYARQWLKEALIGISELTVPTYSLDVPFSGGAPSFISEMLVSEYKTPNVDYFAPIHLHARNNSHAAQGGPISHSQTTTQHPALSSKMRIVLVDWLHAICTRLRMSDQTFHLNIALLDISLTLQHGVTTHHLQLLGIAAMFIASKYHEVFPPPVKDFVYMSANAYSAEDILGAEKTLFSMLDCKFAIPCALDAAELLLTTQDPPATPEQRIITNFLLHVHLHHTVYGGGGQSMLAARAAVFISKVVCDIPFMSSQIAKSPSQQRSNNSHSSSRSIISGSRSQTQQPQSCSEVPPKTASASPVNDANTSTTTTTNNNNNNNNNNDNQKPVTSNGSISQARQTEQDNKNNNKEANNGTSDENSNKNKDDSDDKPVDEKTNNKNMSAGDQVEGWKHTSQIVFHQSIAASAALNEIDEDGQLIYAFNGRKGHSSTRHQEGASSHRRMSESLCRDDNNNNNNNGVGENRNRCRDDDDIQNSNSNQDSNNTSTGNNSNQSATTDYYTDNNNNNNNNNNNTHRNNNRNNTTTTNFNNFFNADDFLPYHLLRECHLSQREVDFVETLLDQLDNLRDPETKASDLIARYSHRKFGNVGSMIFDRERIMSVAYENMMVGELFAEGKF